MFKVLLGTDGSACALEAAEYVGNMFSNKPGAVIEALYVEEGEIGSLAPRIPPDQLIEAVRRMKEEAENRRNTVLEATMERLREFAGEAKSRFAEGKAGDIICRIAQDENFDLIAVGSCGKGLVKRSLLGSVSYKVSHQASVPVLIVRAKE